MQSSAIKRNWQILGLGVLLIAALLMGVAVGPVHLSTWQVLHALFRPSANNTVDTIVNLVRLPRVLTAALVGGGLAVSGAIIQAVFKNPMADPGIIGVSAGGTMGAVAALAFSWDVVSPFILPGIAFLGASMAVVLVYILATRKGKTSVIGVLLAGMVISSLIDSGVSLILTFANNDQLRGIVFWLMGGFEGVGWSQWWMAVGPISLGLVAAFLFSRELDLLQTGEESAHSSGVSVEWVKRALLAIVALITGASVAVSGTIAFVGLIVPHMARSIVGPNHRYVLPASALLGGALLVFADMLARSIISTFEINVGIITSFIGGPFFIYLLIREENRGSFGNRR